MSLIDAGTVLGKQRLMITLVSEYSLHLYIMKSIAMYMMQELSVRKILL